MTTRLTKLMREEILNRIMQATAFPTMYAEIKKETSIFASKFLSAQIPKEFKEFSKNAPKEWFMCTSHVYFKNEVCPMYLLNSAPPTGHTAKWSSTVSLYDSVPRPADFKPMVVTSANGGKELAALVDRATQYYLQYTDTRNKVASTLSGYRTVDRLVKDVPEFEKHCVYTKPSYAVTVDSANTLSALFKAGFDTTTSSKAKTKK